MKKGQAHPAALLSKKMISGALLEILQEKEYRQITITEVCIHAQIARRTFYRNFVTIEDVLVFAIKNIISDFSVEMKKHSQENLNDILIVYFTFWTSHSDLLKLLNKNGLTYIIFIEYIQCMQDLPFLYHIHSTDTLKTDEFPFIHAFITGGLWSMLTHYIHFNCKETPEQLAQILTGKLFNA